MIVSFASGEYVFIVPVSPGPLGEEVLRHAVRRRRHRQ